MTTRRTFLRTASAAGLLLATAGRGVAAPVEPVTREGRRDLTPDEALARLQQGNARLLDGTTLERDLLAEIKATASGQHPFAGVLGCIDSRVPPELIFDQGIGDIFCARVAGNFANTDIIGSLEFATKVAGAKLILVLGHTECGAIKGACDDARLGNLSSTLSNIMPSVYAVGSVQGERSSKNSKFVEAVALENVRQTVRALTHRSVILHDLAEQGAIKVVGAMHDIGTGKVSPVV